jgi:DNA-binding HxlR family transcriptional regulator
MLTSESIVRYSAGMDWLDFDTGNCTVARTLGLVGDRWSLLVLREAFNGVRRFDDLHRHLGIAPTVLTKRLDELVRNGLLSRAPYQERGQRVRQEYRLTPVGWDLQPVVIAIMAFGDKHLADPEGPPVRLEHAGCGAAVKPQLACEDGHQLASPREISLTPGPSARAVDGRSGG